MKKIYRWWKYTIQVSRAGGLINKGKYQKAISLIERLEIPTDEKGRVLLLKANALFKLGSLAAAYDCYGDFLATEKEGEEPDSIYLNLYAKFWSDTLVRKLELTDTKTYNVSRKELNHAFSKVNLLTRTEFPL